MKGGLKTLIILLFATLTTTISAQQSNDSISTDSVEVVVADSVISSPQQKPSFLKRAYKFIDGVLSPERDKNFIDVQDYYNWCGMLQFTGRFETYRIDNGDELSMELSPRFSTRVGPFFGWRFLFSGYNFDLKYLIPKSNGIDLTASIYSAAFGFDLFYRRVGGDYNIKSLTYKSIDYTDNLRGVNFTGISTGMTRVSFYYIKNYKRYSHQAAFNQTHRQIQSAGSPIIGASYAHNRTILDWNSFAMLTNYVQDKEKIEEVRSKTINDEFAFTLGYGYNYVFAKNWLAAGEIMGSIGYLRQRYDADTFTSDISQEKQPENTENESGISKLYQSVNEFRRKNLAHNTSARLSALYNCGPWFAGTQIVMFYYQNGNAKTQTRNLLGCVYLFVGCNF